MRALALVAALLATPAAADSVGSVIVIDGDTIEVGGVRVRLFGIDAPEALQICQTASGDPWPCGQWATDQLRARFGGAEADCVMVEVDRYGREVSRCTALGADIGGTLVRAGIAFAYRDYSWDYDPAEKSAQVEGLGLWSGDFAAPAAFRAGETGGDCLIKGNISANGRIYHVPGQEHYDETRIDPGRGERWFCSEAEAEAAGWRPARR